MLQKYTRLAVSLRSLAKISQFPRFSSKKSEKSRQKLEKERVYESVSSLETMADQETLTKESISRIIEERRQELNKIAAETKIPKAAFLAAMLITAPVVLGPISLFLLSKYGVFSQALPGLAQALLKYSAVQLNFLVIS